MILDQISVQNSERWYLDEVLYDRLVYRTNFTSDPFAAMEFVLRGGEYSKAYVLFKGEDNKPGMQMFIQKEIDVCNYLSLADSMSDMFYEFII
jgi:hypothetical protein